MMSKPRKRYILLVVICVIFITLIYLEASSGNRSRADQQEAEMEERMTMPEEKIIRIVLDKVNDILRLHPR